MPKSLPIEPGQVRTSGTLKFTEIPINQYKRNIKNEKTRFGKAGLLAMLHDMIVVREIRNDAQHGSRQWERGKASSTTTGGRPTSSIGQEAAVVGQAAALDPDDFIFGRTEPRRDPRQMPLRGAQDRRRELISIMEAWLGGETFEYAKRMPHGDTFSLARNFIRVRHSRRDICAQGRLNRGMADRCTPSSCPSARCRTTR